MTEETFTALAQSADELKRMDLADDIWAVKERYDKGMYCIALIGQFSAGKSSLLNNLLGRDILPHGRQETTAVLTFIRGTEEREEEGALLHYKNGESRALSLDEVKMLSQHQAAEDWNLEESYSLDIHLNGPILKNGLVLLDTPGVNTIIERHELLLAYALKASSHVIYVSQGAPTSVDIEKLQMLQEMGIPMSYVRTHFDEIHSSEENPADTMEKDKETFRNNDIHLDEGNVFYISNLSDSSWFGNINEIKILLAKKGDDTKASLEEETCQRLAAVKSVIYPKLDDLYQTLQAQVYHDDAALSDRRRKLKNNISNLEQSLNHHQVELQKEIQKARNDFEKDLKDSVQKSVDRFSRKLQDSDSIISSSDMQTCMQKEWKNALNDIQRHINSTMNPIVEAINGVMPVLDESLSIEDLPEVESYEEVMQTQDAACERLKEILDDIHERQNSLSQDSVDLSGKKAELEELERAVQEAVRAYDARDPYVPKQILVPSGDNTGSQVGKTIGAILDLVMLVLPTPAGKAGTVAKAGSAAGKTAKSVTTTQKAIQAGQKLIKGANVAKTLIRLENTARKGKHIAKAAQKLSSTDKFFKYAKDTAETVQTLKKAAKKSDQPNILDYLTLEYWGEKVGSCFDEPPKYDIDREYEAKYQSEKKRLEEEKERVVKVRLRKEEEYGILKKEEDKRQRKLALLNEEEKNARDELDRKKREIWKKASDAARANWYRRCISYYKNQLGEVVNKFSKSYLSAMPKRLQQYQVQRFRLLYERINQQKQILEDLDSQSPEEIKKRIQKIRKLLDILQSIHA